jgi:hypothetical protein
VASWLALMLPTAIMPMSMSRAPMTKTAPTARRIAVAGAGSRGLQHDPGPAFAVKRQQQDQCAGADELGDDADVVDDGHHPDADAVDDRGEHDQPDPEDDRVLRAAGRGAHAGVPGVPAISKAVEICGRITW